MRKIVVHLTLSLDGCFEGPDHDLSWHLVDEELHAHFNAELATDSAFLEGRVTYQLMEAFWPTADQDPDAPPTVREFAGIWRAVPKIVFSRTLQAVGPNASLRAEVDPDEIRALKEQPGGDMTLGGVDLVGTFRRLDLIDEYRLYVAPVVLGRGRRLFETGDEPTHLELVEHRRFGNGVVLLRYAVRRPRSVAWAPWGSNPQPAD
ncbi:dihydrofolate reductase family protein [Geodermatophilus sp. DSM 44513]|uniref:dihydrofolate reductase family protein n=1 Tax=Geodermatophilus sp. DSM 44513 TaxID=1528104 RepID=UPI001277C730|nr:dihydrofolate reductase family protein [Geodermatophilus sp. DSM 44513]WNV75144.1 dihydrofolate reductase family protein [Geodermatophilus sp. DSM 44513]